HRKPGAGSGLGERSRVRPARLRLRRTRAVGRRFESVVGLSSRRGTRRVRLRSIANRLHLRADRPPDGGDANPRDARGSLGHAGYFSDARGPRSLSRRGVCRARRQIAGADLAGTRGCATLGLHAVSGDQPGAQLSPYGAALPGSPEKGWPAHLVVGRSSDEETNAKNPNFLL